MTSGPIDRAAVGLLVVTIFHDLKALLDVERLFNVVVVENERHRYLRTDSFRSLQSLPERFPVVQFAACDSQKLPVPLSANELG
jgi:hypothetical protein